MKMYQKHILVSIKKILSSVLINYERTKNYTIGVVHHMVALGVDELDQDIRMSHRQNYRRLKQKYPNVNIKYVFGVKQDKEGKTNVGFESQFDDIILGRHFEHILWSNEVSFYTGTGLKIQFNHVTN